LHATLPGRGHRACRTSSGAGADGGMLSRVTNQLAMSWNSGAADSPPSPWTPRWGASSRIAMTYRGSSAGRMPGQVIQWCVEEGGAALTALAGDAALGVVEHDRDDVPRVVGGQDAGEGDPVVRVRVARAGRVDLLARPRLAAHLVSGDGRLRTGARLRARPGLHHRPEHVPDGRRGLVTDHPDPLGPLGHVGVAIGTDAFGDDSGWHPDAVIGDRLEHARHLQRGHGQALADGQVGEGAALPVLQVRHEARGFTGERDARLLSEP